jgi:hypothetical protein
MGKTARGERRMVHIRGGRVEGDRLRGEVLDGGADWQMIHPDGMLSIEAQYAIKTHDGAVIYVRSIGVRDGSPFVLAQLGRGEAVDPADYYFRTSIQLETGSPEYDWVNRTVLLCSAARFASQVVYDLYRVT